MKNMVSVTQTNGYEDLVPLISSAIENIGGLDLSSGDRVLIKPNLCNFRAPSTGAITHPIFLDALFHYLRDEFKNLDITMVESNATSSIPDITLKWFGFDKILKKWDVAWYNLSDHPLIIKKINGLYFKEMEISEIYDDYNFFITLPKLKTHSLTKITASLKNQFGCIPYKNKVTYHTSIDQVIGDANLAMTPDLCLVDGILSMVGGVAIYGTPIKSNLLIAGKDPVSVDTVCSKVLSYSPRKIGHIKTSKKLGVGSDKYILSGDVTNLDQVKINNEIPFYKELTYNVGRYIQKKHSLTDYFKKKKL